MAATRRSAVTMTTWSDCRSTNRVSACALLRPAPKPTQNRSAREPPLAARADDDLRRRYFRVMHRRGPPNAKVALARQLLVRLYIMLRDQIDYEEFRLRGRAPPHHHL